MASTDVFEEHLSLISALSDNYARSEDRAAVSEFLKTQNEIVGMLKRSEDMMNEHVRGERFGDGVGMGGGPRPRKRGGGQPLGKAA